MIRHLYWDAVSTTTDDAAVSSPRRLYAIWPSPIDADVCFEDAGFAEFADTDDEWDADWRRIVDAAMTYLSRYGAPAIRNQIVPGTRNRLVDRLLRGFPKFNTVVLSLVEQVVLATKDDRFPHAVIDFGREHVVTLVTGDGHPILWIILDVDVEFHPEDMAGRIGQSGGFARRQLDWSKLRLSDMPV